MSTPRYTEATIADIPSDLDREAAILQLAEERLGTQVKHTLPLRLAREAARIGLAVGRLRGMRLVSP